MFSLPVLVHKLLLSNGEGAEFVAKGVFILSNDNKKVKMDCLIEQPIEQRLNKANKKDNLPNSLKCFGENQMTQTVIITSQFLKHHIFLSVL